MQLSKAMAGAITATLYSDPACPWAYSANPALAVLRWRYRDGIDWRLVTIGLTESARQYEERGYSPAKMARGYARFRRFGMPFATEPRPRVAGTSRACRAIVATRMRQAELAPSAYRALQFGWFTTTLVLDQDPDIATALREVPGLDVDAIVGALDDPEVVAAYEADKRESRVAAGGPTEFQGKARNTDGEVRFSAPSVVFQSSGGARLEAGGFQPVEAYDALIANLPERPARHAPPDSPLEAIELFDFPLTTQEIAAIMAQGNDAPDRNAAEGALIDLAAEGSVRRVAVGDDAVWARPRAVSAGVRAA